MVYYSDKDGISSGASGDLQIDTRLARAMICSFGMDDEIGIKNYVNMKKKNLLLMVVIASFAILNFTALNAKTIYYVKVNRIGNGTSWANAAGNIQEMIDKAVAGDEVWVAAGTYYPTAGESISKSFNLKKGVNLYGGFAGNETGVTNRTKSDKDSNGKTEAWEFTNETILSGKISNNENCLAVVTLSGSYENYPIFDGFTVMNGVRGIIVEGNSTVNNCIICDNGNNEGGNSDEWSGCGIENKGAIVSNSKITNNKAYFRTPYRYYASNYSIQGGGIYNSGTVINCIITNNRCEIYDTWGHLSVDANGGGIGRCSGKTHNT